MANNVSPKIEARERRASSTPSRNGSTIRDAASVEKGFSPKTWRTRPGVTPAPIERSRLLPFSEPSNLATRSLLTLPTGVYPARPEFREERSRRATAFLELRVLHSPFSILCSRANGKWIWSDHSCPTQLVLQESYKMLALLHRNRCKVPATLADTPPASPYGEPHEEQA